MSLGFQMLVLLEVRTQVEWLPVFSLLWGVLETGLGVCTVCLGHAYHTLTWNKCMKMSLSLQISTSYCEGYVLRILRVGALTYNEYFRLWARTSTADQRAAITAMNQSRLHDTWYIFRNST